MIGRTISHYKILEKLGEGAIGVVYKAEDTKLRRTVALKFLSAEALKNEEERRRFVHEAQAAALLDHPNICAVYDIDHAEGHAFIVMGYVDGPTLAQRIKERPLPLEEALDIAIQTGQGLQEAHEKAIVHRDIKSANILLTSKGQAKLADFGLAHLADRTKITKTGTTLGTPAYMSPEQAHGQKTDRRTDIWSLGVVLYEMLTGRLPFVSEYPQAVVYSIINDEVEPATSLRTGVPTELDWVISKALAKVPEQRYQHVDEMLVDLREIHRQASSSGVKTPWPRRSVSPMGPRQVRGSAAGSRRVLAGVAVSSVALLALIWLAIASFRQNVADQVVAPTITEHKRLVVLPFKTPVSDPERRALVDGLVEVLTSELTQLERFHDSLLVVPFSEVLERGAESPSQAHQEFGATLAVTGSLLGTRENLRLVVNLVDIREMRQLSSAVIEGVAGDLRALEDKTAETLAGFVGLSVAPGQIAQLRGGVPHVPGAYEFYLQGYGYLQRYGKTVENVDTAIQLFREALDRDPSYALAYAGLGQAYWRKHRYEKDKQWVELAVEHCNRAAELNDQLPDVHVALGLVHSGTGRYEDAVNAFLQALDLDPRRAEAHQGLARAYAALGRIEEAEATFKKAIAIRPDYWDGYNQLGLFYYHQSRYDEAVQQLRRVVDLTPDNARGYLNLGAMLYYIEDFEGARRMFERSVEIEPQYRALSNLGELYFQEGKNELAVHYYERALQINDREHVVWGNLAEVYLREPDGAQKARHPYERAAQLASEMLRVDPDSAGHTTFLALYSARLGRRAEAERLIQRALDLAADNLNILVRAGEAYEVLELRGPAIDCVLKAIQEGYPLTLVERNRNLQKLCDDSDFQLQLSKLQERL